MTDLIAVFLFIGVVAYALLGGADFGAGFWDLTAGGAERGRAPRHLVDVSLSPVWEANHTWLIYCLVMLWTGFPRAFAAITTTLYFPLGIAALGIVLRGAGFAFRHASIRTSEQRLFGAAFALSSILAPYCFGSIVGGIASGRVPTSGYGDPATSWLNPTSALGGVLAVLVCAYLAAVYLCVMAARDGDAVLERYFRDRALGAAVVTGAVSIAGIFILHSDAHRLFHELSHRALPLVILAAVGGIVSIVLLLRYQGIRIGLRETAAAAVALVVLGWGVAQYPYLLGTHLTLDQGAAPRATLWVLVGVAIAAGVLILPSLVVLFRLAGRGRLGTPSDTAAE
ncbi:cytochrome bd-I ubiquinol oxidase subunit 2 apoprotein [Actinacidiphila rubida]|uniref:Cytochrome bd-I ubiquinol oxidase subunit 2 apoprotein n=1 Tax=Actinacidiphila rubida TaxID=310780 RepID=A0A1H8LHL0_9ACTN|nr:cytochrome d ubiquinol oxidase subunit II [Actinacidiphila rubida]SEO04615.1 cytochrome bd-I ubiquinol oxidase subunit 2 apoprotein [Actinacidiphila rubida]